MADLVLRVNAARFDVDRFLARHLDLKPSLVWREGETRRGRAQETSGFNLPVVDEDDYPKLVAQLRSVLTRLEPILAELVEYGATVELDAAVMVEEEHPVRSFGLEPDELALLANLRIAFGVTAYASASE